MYVLIGLVIVFGSIIAGFLMHHGHLMVLLQVSEFIIIGGSALGSMIISNPMSLNKRIATGLMDLMKPNPYTRQAYSEVLRLMYELFQKAKKEGLVALESQIEEPDKSEIFRKYPTVMKQHHAVAFLTDTLKVLLTGAVDVHHLADILEMDMETQHSDALTVPAALNKVGDAMPGFGIVAAVLGVVITMGSIGGAASEIGEKVAAALVGTFLGILLSYGVIGPLAGAIESRIKSEEAYMTCIRTALLSFAREDSPMTSVEFARRGVDPGDRPSFAELEGMLRQRAET